MYIDSLTVTGLVVFFGAMALFVNYCLVRVCGLIKDRKDGNGVDVGKRGS